MKKSLFKLMCTSTALGMVVMSHAASAQEGAGAAAAKPAETGPGDAEIVVTAQKRAERLQDVPIAITAVSGDMLQSRGLKESGDLNAVVPNLNVQRVPRTQAIFLRGVGNNSTAPGQEQNVAIFVDGVYYPAMTANVFNFNNVERVEVLRGPQGTLFGRNTTGGIIHVVTRDPSPDFDAEFQAGVANYETYSGSAYVTGGLTESLRADLAVQFQDQRRGWGRNLTRDTDTGFARDFNVRSKIVFEPSESTKAVLALSYFRSRSDLGSARNVLPSVTSTPASHGNVAFNGNIYDSFANDLTLDTTTQRSISLRVDQDLGFANLVSISAAQKVKTHSLADSDQTPAFRNAADTRLGITSYSQELQLQSKADEGLQWILGFYYFHSRDGLFPRDTYSRCTTPGVGTCLANGSTYTRLTDAISVDSFAPFAQGTIEILPDTNLTIGGRYTIDKREFEGRQENALGAPTPFGGGLPNPFDLRHTWKQATFKVGIDHHFSRDAMIYATISSGFKSGLWNGTTPSSLRVNPEKLLAYEVGFKLEAFDRKVRINGAAFYYDYKDLQSVKRDSTSTVVLVNAADSRIYGAELETDFYPAEGLHLYANGAWLNAKYSSFPGAVGTIPGADHINLSTTFDAEGNMLPRAPKGTATAGFDYSFDTKPGSATISAMYYYNSGYYFEVDNRLKQPSVGLLNASLKISDSSDKFSVSFWGSNILNKEYYTYMTGIAGNPDLGAPAAPRTYGVTLSARM